MAKTIIRKLKPFFSREKIKDTLLLLGGALFLILGILYGLNAHLHNLYLQQLSIPILDRNGQEIELRPNIKKYYTRTIEEVPQNLKHLLLQKEDRYFFFHLGINPVSIVRDMLSYFQRGRLGGSSTISQQLVKNLLSQENERTVFNKLIETGYTLGLEIFTPKDQVLTMYANTAYLGRQAQGFGEASNYYFGVIPEALTNRQTLSLLATLNNPSERYPGTSRNSAATELLAKNLGVTLETSTPALSSGYQSRKSDASFELQGLDIKCLESCSLTLDQELTENIREILKRHLSSQALDSVENGAIVVLRTSPKEDRNELLAIVGSPNPESRTLGQQINLALRPRPIGSTIKPFIYTKAFEKGLRPYTLVDDREYRYTIGTGYSFYPKNFDGQYRGLVTLHQALSNSLNVPTVKVLEHLGIRNFNQFLENDLAFRSRQPLENYELSIALGGLEMDLLTLTNYFSVFPNNGVLKPLMIGKENVRNPLITLPMAQNVESPKKIFDSRYVELTNTILNDRKTGVNQFGLKSNLNLSEDNYGVKTGTSYDFHDSWTVGFTPDFVVGVWLGNSDNTPIRQVTGQAGAGTIWHDVMEVLLNSPYNLHTSLSKNEIQTFSESTTLEYGLPGDDYRTIREGLTGEKLILEPHQEDVYLYESRMTIPFKSQTRVTWFINNLPVAKNTTEFEWHPTKSGIYTIEAKTADTTERIRVTLKEEE
ncbi:MAG: transglycosylase domain-containing protein [Patescibacteria group bacterium]